MLRKQENFERLQYYERISNDLFQSFRITANTNSKTKDNKTMRDRKSVCVCVYICLALLIGNNNECKASPLCLYGRLLCWCFPFSPPLHVRICLAILSCFDFIRFCFVCFTFHAMTFWMMTMASCLHNEWYFTHSSTSSPSLVSIFKIEYYCCFMWIHIQTLNIAYLCSMYAHRLAAETRWRGTGDWKPSRPNQTHRR